MIENSSIEHSRGRARQGDAAVAFISSPIVLIAACFALLTGLLEGIGLWVFQMLHWQDWSQARTVTPDIVWVTTAFDLVGFCAVALLMIPVARRIPRVSSTRLAVFVFSFLTFFDWLLLSARLRRSSGLILAIGLSTIVTRWFSKSERTTLFRRSRCRY